MARKRCSDHEWFLTGACKTRLFALWFGAAERETEAHTPGELEKLIGATGPNSLTKDILPRLVSLGLVEQIGSKYQPVPMRNLAGPQQEMRRALEVFLTALAKL